MHAGICSVTLFGSGVRGVDMAGQGGGMSWASRFEGTGLVLGLHRHHRGWRLLTEDLLHAGHSTGLLTPCRLSLSALRSRGRCSPAKLVIAQVHGKPVSSQLLPRVLLPSQPLSPAHGLKKYPWLLEEICIGED